MAHSRGGWVCLLAAGVQLAAGAALHAAARPADDALVAEAAPEPGEVRWEVVDEGAGKGPIPSTDAACVAAGRAFYMLGGVGPFGRVQHAVWRFEDKQWTKIWDKEEGPARARHTAVLAGDWIYVFGGVQDSSTAALVRFGPLVRFGTRSLQWEPSSAGDGPPSTLSGHAAALVDDCMYIFGGWDGQADRNDLHCYSVSRGVWTKVPASGNIPSARRDSAAAGVDGFLYVFGGRGATGSLGDLHRLDCFWDNWEAVTADGAAPSPRYSHTAAASGNSIYIFGGMGTPTGGVSDVHRYNVRTNEWQLVASAGQTPPGREGHVAAFVGSSMYVFGGTDGVVQEDSNKHTLFSGLWGLSLCAPGAGLSSGQTPRCEVCVAGRYGAVGECLWCAPGRMSAAGRADCEACPPGMRSDSNGTACEACPAGTFPSGNSCSPCEAGSWSPAGAPQCEECGAGRYSGEGAPECLECAAGSVSQNASARCEECPAGTHNESGADCVPCAAGFHAPAGSSECERCDPGRSSRVGSETCFSEVGIFVGAGLAGGALAVLLVAIGIVALMSYGRRLDQSQEKRRLTLEMTVLSSRRASASREQEVEAQVWVPPHPAPPNW